MKNTIYSVIMLIVASCTTDQTRSNNEKIKYSSGSTMFAGRAMFGGITRDDRYEVAIIEPFADSLWMRELVEQGKIIPIKKGDKLLILDTSPISPLIRVKIQEGEYSGKSCFIPREYLEANTIR